MTMPGLYRNTGIPSAIKAAALLLALSALPAAAGGSASDPLLSALKTELARSTGALAHAEAAPLYYLAYEAYDTTSYWLSAKEGAVMDESEGRNRRLDVDARVGSPQLDNTHEFKGASAGANSNSQENFSLPLGDDHDAVRAEVWNLTDRAYKSALDRYAKVRMNKSVTAEEEDKSGDFSAEPPASRYSPVAAPAVDKAKFRAMLRRLSERFKKQAFIYDSDVSLSVDSENRYLLNSEGSEQVTGNNFIRLSYSAYTRTADGMGLARDKVYDAADPASLPSEEQVARDIDRSIDELKAMAAVPAETPYSGPMLLEARAAGVFFHEILGHRLEGHRQKSEMSGQTFAAMVGKPIMPAFLSVYDDPTQGWFGPEPLRGFYLYDDEGAAARRTALVEGGVLKGFLMSRSPVKGFPASNGHGRRAPGFGAVARMGNLIVTSSSRVPYGRLRARLLDEVRKAGKPFGIIVSDISGGQTITTRDLPQSFSVGVTMGWKVYPDGRPDEALRGLNLIGTPLQTFSRLLVTGDDDAVFNGTCGAESGWVPVSAVSPSLLFSEMETEKVQKSNERPPVLKPPYTDK
jgi:predicted Zn-dependent protease